MKVAYISVIIVIVDQLSKFLVKGFSIPFLNINYPGMYIGERIEVIGDFFRITFIENPGMAFGLDPGSEYKLLLTLFSLAASIGLIIYLYIIRNESLSLRIALAFILGGAVGNLIDRTFYGVLYDYAPLFYGKVVDFLDFDFFNFTIFGRSYDRWPIFNIADSAVTIGVLIMLIFYRSHNKKDENKSEISNNDKQINTFAENEVSSDKSEHINDLNNDKPDKGKEI